MRTVNWIVCGYLRCTIVYMGFVGDEGMGTMNCLLLVGYFGP